MQPPTMTHITVKGGLSWAKAGAEGGRSGQDTADSERRFLQTKPIAVPDKPDNPVLHIVAFF